MTLREMTDMQLPVLPTTVSASPRESPARADTLRLTWAPMGRPLTLASFAVTVSSNNTLKERKYLLHHVEQVPSKDSFKDYENDKIMKLSSCFH